MKTITEKNLCKQDLVSLPMIRQKTGKGNIWSFLEEAKNVMNHSNFKRWFISEEVWYKMEMMLSRIFWLNQLQLECIKKDYSLVINK
jgi:hypothetical protein